MKPHSVFSISYYVRRLFKGDKEKGTEDRKSQPSAEAQIHVAAYSQEETLAHAQTIIHRDAIGGTKESDQREITITGVQQGTRAVHVHVAPPAVVVEDSSKVFTKDQVDKAVADATKSATKDLYTEAEVNGKIADALRKDAKKNAEGSKPEADAAK